MPDIIGRGSDGMIQMGCMPMLDGPGVRVGKGIREGEPPTMPL